MTERAKVFLSEDMRIASRPSGAAPGAVDWQLVQFLYAQVHVRGRMLGLSVMRSPDSPSEWVVACVEGPSRRRGQQRFDALEEILSDHSHAALGPFASEEEAKDAAGAYAADWKRRRRAQRSRRPKCDCEEISAVPPGAA